LELDPLHRGTQIRVDDTWGTGSLCTYSHPPLLPCTGDILSSNIITFFLKI
jgi:hypothetical protein